MNSDQLLLPRGAARHIVIALSFGMVMSCATTPAPQPRLDATGVEKGPIEAKTPAPEEAAAAEPASQTAAMFVGNDQNVNMPVARPPLFPPFEDSEALVRVVLSLERISSQRAQTSRNNFEKA